MTSSVFKLLFQMLNSCVNPLGWDNLSLNHSIHHCRHLQPVFFLIGFIFTWWTITWSTLLNHFSYIEHSIFPRIITLCMETFQMLRFNALMLKRDSIYFSILLFSLFHCLSTFATTSFCSLFACQCPLSAARLFFSLLSYHPLPFPPLPPQSVHANLSVLVTSSEYVSNISNDLYPLWKKKKKLKLRHFLSKHMHAAEEQQQREVVKMGSDGNEHVVCNVWYIRSTLRTQSTFSWGAWVGHANHKANPGEQTV